MLLPLVVAVERTEKRTEKLQLLPAQKVSEYTVTSLATTFAC